VTGLFDKGEGRGGKGNLPSLSFPLFSPILLKLLGESRSHSEGEMRGEKKKKRRELPSSLISSAYTIEEKREVGGGKGREKELVFNSLSFLFYSLYANSDMVVRSRR